MTISKAKVPGFTIEKYKQFKAEVAKYMPMLDSRLTMTMLPDLEGHMVAHT